MCSLPWVDCVFVCAHTLRLDDMDLASQSPEHLKFLGLEVMHVKHDLILPKAA